MDCSVFWWALDENACISLLKLGYFNTESVDGFFRCVLSLLIG